MTTPLEREPAHNLDAAVRAAPEPLPNVVEDEAWLFQRRRRRHWAAASAVTALVVVAVGVVAIIRAPSPREDTDPAPVAALPVTDAPLPATVVTDGCTVHVLPLPPRSGPSVDAESVDPTGRYVTGSVEGHVGSVLLWIDGKPQLLDIPAPAKGREYPVGVNAAGVVVGYSDRMGGWVYRHGQVSWLPALPGKHLPGPTWPSAINNRGDVVGISGGRAVIWPADQPGRVRQVGYDVPGEITGISDDGLMVGKLDQQTRLWNRDGTIHFPPLGFRNPHLIAGAWVLGELGVGPATALTDSGFPYALWNLKTGATIALAVDATAATSFYPEGLSETGAVLVGLRIARGSRIYDQANVRPAILRDGKVILLPLPESPADTVALAISGDGHTIVGNDQNRALLWHC